MRTIAIPTGFYLLCDEKNPGNLLTYSGRIKAALKERKHDETAIIITLDESTGLVLIKVDKNYKVYFDGDNNWRDALGFNSEELTSRDQTYVGNKITHLWATRKVYI